MEVILEEFCRKKLFIDKPFRLSVKKNSHNISFPLVFLRIDSMTIPSRPAPAPPQQRSSTGSQLRYTPTTDWDDSPFDMAAHGAAEVNQAGGIGNGRKVPPPRPPPPKATKPPLKKSGHPQSVNILSNLFGATGRRAKTPPTKSTAGPHIGALKLPPPKVSAQSTIFCVSV